MYESYIDLIVNLTPTGMIPTREMTKHVPLSPQEIIEDVLQCRKLGVTIVHLHARDIYGKPTYKKEIYSEIIKGIRAVDKDLILCASTSGRDFGAFQQRAEVLELEGDAKPDMASLTLSSLNFNQTASVNSPDMIQKLAAKMLEKGIKPELEVFDVGMINYAKYLIKKGLLKPPYYFNLLLGNIACAQANLMHLGYMIQELPENSYYSVAGIGNAQLPMNAVSIAYGAGVRVGLEDNIWFDDERTQLATNYKLVERLVTVASTLGRKVMSPLMMRALLKLDEVSAVKKPRKLGNKKKYAPSGISTMVD